MTALPLSLLLCPICAVHRAQSGAAAAVLLGMIFVPYFVVLLVVRAIQRADA
jgi:hypothetical protein